MDRNFKVIEGGMRYFNNIHTYGGNSQNEHQAIVQKVLQQYVEYALVVHILKCEFFVHGTIFLVHVINGWEVKMDTQKLKTMSK